MNPTHHSGRGQAVYNRLTLSVYDAWVHRFSNPWLWRCPTDELHAMYTRCAGASHLDVGVGTGHLLVACRFGAAANPRVGLLDMNAASLARASARIAHLDPTCWERDVLRPLNLQTEAFDSIGLTYLLHCLPGSWQTKLAAVDHLLPWLGEGAPLFGATLIGEPRPERFAARALMAFYNRRGIFSNRHDDEAGLRAGLLARFESVDCRRVGSVLLFEARHPRPTP